VEYDFPGQTQNMKGMGKPPKKERKEAGGGGGRGEAGGEAGFVRLVHSSWKTITAETHSTAFSN
jgi:hypothetical protein